MGLGCGCGPKLRAEPGAGRAGAWNGLIRSLRPNLCRARGYNTRSRLSARKPMGGARRPRQGKVVVVGAETFRGPGNRLPPRCVPERGRERQTHRCRPPLLSSSAADGLLWFREEREQGCRDAGWHGCALLPAPPEEALHPGSPQRCTRGWTQTGWAGGSLQGSEVGSPTGAPLSSPRPRPVAQT